MEVPKVLFVCRNNIGRSVVGEAFCNELTINMAESAGISVDYPGQKVSNRPEARYTIEVMRENYGIDVSKHSRQQVTPEMVQKFGQVVVLAEKDVIPDWFSDYSFVWWNVPDLKDVTKQRTRETIGEIHALVATELM